MDYMQNVSAFFLPLVLFIYWGVIGYVSLNLLRSQRYTLQNLLLAPVIGCVVNLMPIFWLNRIGIPVGHFASILGMTLLATSTALLFWRKPLFPIRYYLPFSGIFFIALYLVGSPLLKFGFDWVSYGNDDMTNYALAASRFLNHGYFDVPDINSLLQRKDYSLIYWFSHVPGMIRSGADLLLAWVSGVTHLNPLQAFMPTIIAFHLMLISTTGALVYLSQRKYYVAITTCLLLSFSALTGLGTFYQLIAQVSGISILIACVILLCHSFSIHQRYYVLRQSILIALMLSGLLLVYPEVIAFLAVSFFVYFTVKAWKERHINKTLYKVMLGVTCFTILFLITHLFSTLEFIYLQYSLVLRKMSVQVVLFPYFLLPSGLASLWGLLVLTDNMREPMMSLIVISGAMLTLFVIIATLRLVFLRGSTAAVVSLVMICVGINLFINNSGFSLFKLAMFAQPFFISVIALTVFELVKSNKRRGLIFLGLILAGLSSFHFYSERSQAKIPGPFTEIAYGSDTKINQEYRKLVAESPKDALLFSDDFNISLIKSQALQSASHSFVVLTSPSNFMLSVLPDRYRLIPTISNKLFYSDVGKKIARQYAKNSFYNEHFNLLDNNGTQTDFTENNFCSSLNECNTRSMIIADTELRSIFNRRQTRQITTKHNFVLKKFSDLSNHLVFLDSSLGKIYHSVISNNLSNLSLFNLEQDVSYSDTSMQAVGRYLLMKILNPSQQFRFEIALTNTYDGNGLNTLPPLSVIGSKRVALPIMGRGSAHVFSEPLSPQMIRGLAYIATDMNVEGKSFPSRRRGIMNLYNKNLDLDLRQVVTFARNISLVSDDEYQKLAPPNAIRDFPKDLAHRDLAYSGIYEDGWISENSFTQLKQPTPNAPLTLQGMLPRIDQNFRGTTLLVLLDGKKLSEQQLQPGEFNITIPVISDAAIHKIELHFGQAQNLPRGDGRPIAAHLTYIGFG